MAIVGFRYECDRCDRGAPISRLEPIGGGVMAFRDYCDSHRPPIDTAIRILCFHCYEPATRMSFGWSGDVRFIADATCDKCF